ncbi:MAG: diguanylate cyclase [Candidatus Thiodiazotropha taylori]|nr:diguanylate cyclase [Candidatus Thiodiazotropha taylori]MCG8084699.1 diguanylate cyclase [Candidatus Thiodiazotropha taylori]MCG8089383.1 diguanylate cyclase [Candidatus Thiodiazotropha taylori]MCW4274756.1 diguanylate cyclase [Candidatus Thiodiazotropha taylori]
MQPQERTAILNQFALLTALFLFGMLLLLFYFYGNLSDSLLQKHKDDAREVSQIGMGVIRYFHKLEVAGDLTMSQAKRLAANALESATYKKNGYYWINLGNGTLYMQPHTPERVGVNQIDWTDIKGKRIFEEFIQVAKRGGGWVEYYWQKPHNSMEYNKVSYVDYFEPWDWVLGTGKYLDDIEQETEDIIIRGSTLATLLLLIFIGFAAFFGSQLIDRLSQLAVRDSLTGLYRRRYLIESIPSLIKHQERDPKQQMAILFMDIDHFKEVNDTHGHAAGDEVLTTIAGMLRKRSRPSDLVIRYGGEEFVVVGQFDNDDAILSYAERIRDVVSDYQFVVSENSFNMTISIGVAVFMPGEESFEKAIQRADAYLYQAKENGRDQVVMQ